MITTHQTVLEEETLLWEKTGDQLLGNSIVLDLGDIGLEHGDFVEARRIFQKSLQRFKEFRAKGFLIQNYAQYWVMLPVD